MRRHDSALPPLWTRRRFISGTSLAVAVGAGWLNPLRGFAASLPSAGRMGELVGTDPDGIDLVLERQPLRVAGGVGEAITINGSIPGPVIRLAEGREALIRVHNQMDESTSIHWHGVLLPFTMDGVPGLSFDGIGPGETFTYRYPVRQNGTFWYHSHTGLQEQLGHYGQLVIEPAEPDPVAYDVEYPVILSDWTFEDPHTVLRNLKTIEGYYNFQRPTLANLDEQMHGTGKGFGEVIASRLAWQGMRMDPTDLADITGVTYTFLMNGLAPFENWTAIAQPGQRVRLRLLNASSMSTFDVRIPGLPMTVVQADGGNVQPVETDELRIAVAETYDVIVTLPEPRAYTLFAETIDRSGHARGTLAPRSGMAAAIPERRRRPMLSMADMGMTAMHGAGHAMREGMSGHAHESRPSTSA